MARSPLRTAAAEMAAWTCSMLCSAKGHTGRQSRLTAARTEDASGLEVEVGARRRCNRRLCRCRREECVDPNARSSRQDACEALGAYTWAGDDASISCWEQHSTLLFVQPSKERLSKNHVWQMANPSGDVCGAERFAVVRIHFSLEALPG